MNLIVSVDQNWGIGRDGKLLFFLPADMKFFRETTQGGVVVMGRGTFESLPGKRPLKNRVNIILSGNTALTPEGFLVCYSIEEVRRTIEKYDNDTVFIIGGESLYREFLGDCATAYVTKVERSVPADRYLPNLDQLPDWRLVFESEPQEHEGISFRFCTYRRTERA